MGTGTAAVVVAEMMAVAVTGTMAVAVAGTMAGMAVAVMNRSDPAQDQNLPAADRTQNPALARILGLSLGSSRDLLTETVLPVAAKPKKTDFVLLVYQREGRGRASVPSFCPATIP